MNYSMDPSVGMGSASGVPFGWKYCRMCALEVKQGVCIFGEEGRRLRIPEKIRKTLAILVLEEDSLPKKICTDCCNSLEAFSQFKESVVDAQEKLSSIVRSIERSQDQSYLRLNLLRSPNAKRPKLLASSHVHHPNLLLPALPAPSAEPDLALGESDPTFECDDVPSRPSSPISSDGDENVVSKANPECVTFSEGADKDEDDTNEEPLPGTSSSQSVTIVKSAISPGSSSEEVHGQIHPEQPDKDSSSSDSSPVAYNDDDVRDDVSEDDNTEGEVQLTCGRCTAHLKDRNALQAHHDKHHNTKEEPIYGCSVCQRISSNFEAIRQHLYRHRMAGTFKCTNCERSFPTKDQLHVHISSKHNPAGSKPFTCDICGDKLGSRSALVLHRKNIHRDMENSTEGDIDNTDDEQQNRIKTRRDGKGDKPRSPPKNKAPIPTDTDHEYLSNSTASATEANSVSNNSKDDTTEANSSDDSPSKSNGDLKNAKQLQDSNNETSTVDEDTSQNDPQKKSDGYWKCEQCDKILHSKHGYDCHISVHIGRRYTCEFCGATYTQKGTLAHHVKVHHTNIDKEFECSVCGKFFKTIRQLSWHKKTHETSSTDVTCPVCEKKFLNTLSLKTHFKLHKERNKHPCSLCPKSFFTRLKLQEHMNSHTGKRPYGCSAEGCNKVFCNVSNYVKHFKKRHVDLLGPKGSMTPHPKILDDSTPSGQGEQAQKSANEKTSQSLETRNGAASVSTPTPPNSLSLQPESTIGESSAVSHPTTVIQMPFPSTHSTPTTVILQKPIPSHVVTSSPGTFPTSVLNSSASSIQQQSSVTVNSTSAPVSYVIQPNIPINTSNSAGHGGQAQVITLHSSNDNSMTLAHSHSINVSSGGPSSQTHGQTISAQSAHGATHSTISTHTQTIGVQSHQSLGQYQIQQLQHHGQSVWQPIILPSSKTYNHPNTTAGLATINGLDLIDCAGAIVAAHSSESLTTPGSNHSHGQSNLHIVQMPVTAAHHSTTSHSTTSHLHHHGSNVSLSGNGNTIGQANAHQGSCSHHSSSTIHIPHPTPSAHNNIPLSTTGIVTVPNFVPTSQQSEPMELSYKLDSNNFQEMPMELTKVFQRDPLELCVRQEFGQSQPLMDLSSRVVNVSVGGNQSMNGSSMSLNGNPNSSSQSHFSSGSSSATTTVLSVPYHKTAEMVERELCLNDFTGAFRQPIDLIARSDDHSHELCSEGSLVDLSLRSSFGQDQSASTFLRELIDLSSRPDTFSGEVNLSNKQPTSGTQAHSQSQPQLQHHAHSSASQHSPPKINNPNISHQNHAHGSHHPHHHIQNPSHQHQSTNSSSGVGISVIYSDSLFGL